MQLQQSVPLCLDVRPGHFQMPRASFSKPKNTQNSRLFHILNETLFQRLKNTKKFKIVLYIESSPGLSLE